MSDEEQLRDLDSPQARLAYAIIQSLLEHTRVVSDLIALMAQTLDEDTTKALTQTPVWTAYLDSRRALERTRADIEKFAEVMKQLQWLRPKLVAQIEYTEWTAGNHLRHSRFVGLRDDKKAEEVTKEI